MENKEENLKQSAIALKERLEKEVPIMQQNLVALKRNEQNYAVLPTTVHNIAVIHNEEIYRLIDLISCLWRAGKPGKRRLLNLFRKPAFEKEQKKALEILDYLNLQERKAFAAQLDHVKKERQRIKRLNRRNKARAEKKGELDKFEPQPVPVVKDEIQYFQHVEYDPSRLLIIFWKFVTSGEHPLSDDEVYWLGKIRETCIDIYEKYIPNRLAAIEKCNVIIESYEEEDKNNPSGADAIPGNA